MSLFRITMIMSISLFLMLCACSKKPEIVIPTIEPGEFHITYADNDTTLVQGKKCTVWFRATGEGSEELGVSILLDYGEYDRITTKLNVKDTIFQYEFEIPVDAYFVFFDVNGVGSCYAGSLPRYNEIVYTETGNPAQQAYAYMASDFDDSTDNIQKELELYPDNAMVYMPVWNKYRFAKNFDKLREEMKIVKGKFNDIPEKDAMLAFGFFCLHEKDSAIYHAKKYLESPSPLWAPNIASFLAYDLLSFDNEDESELLLHMIDANMKHSSAGNLLSMYLYSGCKYESELYEKLLMQNFEIRPAEGRYNVRYLTEIKCDTIDAISFLETYKKAYEEKLFEESYSFYGDQIATAMLFGVEYYIEKGKIAKALEFMKPAKEFVFEDDTKGGIALASARIAHAQNNTEELEKNLISALAYGNIPETRELIAEYYPDSNIDSLLSKFFNNALEHNEKAPDYSFVDSKGDTIKPGNGEIHLLHFWGPGCKPCVAEKPDLEKFAAGIKGARLFAVTNFTEDYIQEKNMYFANWENIFDKELFSSFNITSIPRTYIVDQNGYIRLYKLGATGDYSSEETIIKLLEQDK